MTANPHEHPIAPSLQYRVRRSTSIVRGGAPERVYDADAADPSWTPRPVGFTATTVRDAPVEQEPLLWGGDNA